MSIQSRGKIIPFRVQDGKTIPARAIVSFGTNEGQIDVAVATKHALGVSEAISKTGGEVASIAIDGTTFVVAGSAITQGTRIKAGTNGAGIPAASADAFSVGYAMESANAGDLFAMHILPQG